jgi:predicted phosphodiesterase
MRLALISDIHCNLPALEAVLADIADQGITEIVCLGDVMLSGPQPRQVVERVRALDCPVVMGNCDAWALDPKSLGEAKDENERKIQEVDRWTVAQLAPEHLAYLHTFQPTVSIPLDEHQTLLCYHGSPRSYYEQIQPETSFESLAEMLVGTAASVYAGGHTHNQMLRRFSTSLVLNTGSVGLAFDRISIPPTEGTRNPAWAEYATLVAAGDHLMSVSLRRVPFDVEALKSAARESGMPHAEWYAADWGDV